MREPRVRNLLVVPKVCRRTIATRARPQELIGVNGTGSKTPGDRYAVSAVALTCGLCVRGFGWL